LLIFATCSKNIKTSAFSSEGFTYFLRGGSPFETHHPIFVISISLLQNSFQSIIFYLEILAHFNAKFAICNAKIPPLFSVNFWNLWLGILTGGWCSGDW
jgi:hypothetical protein